MKINIKLFLIDFLIAGLIILIGLTISRTFICGMFCGLIYEFVTNLIQLYLEESKLYYNKRNTR